VQKTQGSRTAVRHLVDYTIVEIGDTSPADAGKQEAQYQQDWISGHYHDGKAHHDETAQKDDCFFSA
jgi:hypothetical protein